jgi:small subunit ribosomal protein SAe
MVDMFFYRDPEEIEKENEAANADEATGEWNATIEETDWTIEGSALDGLAGIAAAASEWTSQAAAGDWNAQATSGDWADDEVSAPAPSTGWD